MHHVAKPSQIGKVSEILVPGLADEDAYVRLADPAGWRPPVNCLLIPFFLNVWEGQRFWKWLE